MAAPSAAFTCTVGMECTSATKPAPLSESTMPTPPAALTAALLSVRALVPRVQTTTLPLTLTGSSTAGVRKQRRSWLASAPGRPASSARMTGLGASATALNEAPVYTAPLPSVTLADKARSCVEAPTVVSQGLTWATATAGPLLPADAATKTPALAARKNACSTGSLTLVWLPLMEKLITCTPSATALSMAATLSDVKQEFWLPDPSPAVGLTYVKQTL